MVLHALREPIQHPLAAALALDQTQLVQSTKVPGDLVLLRPKSGGQVADGERGDPELGEDPQPQRLPEGTQHGRALVSGERIGHGAAYAAVERGA